MKSKTSKDMGTVKSIFQDAADEGVISMPTKDLMCVNLDDNVLIGCEGMDIEEIEATEVTLVTLIIDDSPSITGLEDALMEGQHAMLDALKKSKQKDSVLIGQWALNKPDPYHSYVEIEQAVKLDNNNYHLTGLTPLYDRWCEAVMANVAYAQKLRATGTMVRSIIVVLTDGGDNDSRKFRANDCKRIAKDLLASEQFILAFVGVGSEADFRQVARDMGIPDGAVLLTDATSSDMRKIFQLVSQSIIRASQTTVDPSKIQNDFFNVN